jgi:plastocyanin
MTTHDESPIIRTSSKRMAQGIAIIVILAAVGAGILIPSWKQMAHNPPAASLIQPEGPPEGVTGVQTSIGTIEGVSKPNPAESTGPSASSNATAIPGGSASTGPPGTPLTILKGASVQGSPNFDPDTLTVKKGDKITVTNKDNVPHTVTSGTGPTDPTSAKSFDTSIIEEGKSADITTEKLAPGDFPYYCSVHPYMTGKLVVQ